MNWGKNSLGILVTKSSFFSRTDYLTILTPFLHSKWNLILCLTSLKKHVFNNIFIIRRNYRFSLLFGFFASCPRWDNSSLLFDPFEKQIDLRKPIGCPFLAVGRTKGHDAHLFPSTVFFFTYQGATRITLKIEGSNIRWGAQFRPLAKEKN